MEQKKIILPEDPEAAELVTIKMWKTSKGEYFLEKDEKIARWAGSTHDTCKCGKIFKKRGYTVCPECVLENKKQRYAKLERFEWDEDSPVTEFNGDQWFYSWDEIYDYCDHNPCEVSDLMLVLSEPAELPRIDIDDFLADVLPEDEDPPYELIHAAESFNNSIARQQTISYTATNKAVKTKGE